MENSSVIIAIRDLRSLLPRPEKMKWIVIVAFALTVSIFEILTATVIVIFAQIISAPDVGQKYWQYFFEQAYAIPTPHIILYTALVCALIYICKNMIAACEIFFQNFTIQMMSYRFKNRMLSRYSRMDYGTYINRNSAFGLQVIGGEIDLVFSNGMLALAIITSETVVFISLLTLLVILNPLLILVFAPLSLIIALLVVKILLPKFYKWGQSYQASSIHTVRNLMQFFHAFKEITILNKRDYFIESYKIHAYDRARLQAIQTATNALPRITIESLFVTLFCAAIIYLAFQMDSAAQMIGILGGYMYAGFRLMPGLNRIITQLNVFKGSIPSIQRLHSEYFSPTTEDSYQTIPDLRFEKSITFSHVTFSYIGTDRPSLLDINCTIRQGECIGIVGETGSGKSTFVDLLIGLQKPQHGSILIDDLYPVDSYQWHDRIGYVPQSIYLIDDTIAANIAFGEKPEDINHERIQSAIRAAQLEGFIDDLTEGINTVVGERGIRLSGGERQRIAIARALYREPEILIFDEATSALDNDTESRLMKTIDTLIQNKTVIMVAHRLTTLEKCDRILTLRRGRLEDTEQDKVTEEYRV